MDKHPVFDAIVYDKLEEVRQLLRADPRCVHLVDGAGYTPLHWAANPLGKGMTTPKVTDENHPEIARLLLEHGADVNARGQKNGHTPLRRAAVLGAVEVVELLLAHGADPNLPDTIGRTPIFAAVWDCLHPEKSEAMTRMLLEHGAIANLHDEQGQTPLHSARCVQAARLLLERGVDVNAQNKEGLTPLLIAADNYPPAITRLLLEHGADYNVRDQEGRTALHRAAIDEDLEVAKVKRLVRLGVILEARDKDGRTALHQAAGSHFFAAVKALLAAGADVNVRDNHGQTPLGIVESGQYLGINSYYQPPPEGEGDPDYFAKGQRKMARILRQAGGQL